jgi:hypothetical protein
MMLARKSASEYIDRKVCALATVIYIVTIAAEEIWMYKGLINRFGRIAIDAAQQ